MTGFHRHGDPPVVVAVGRRTLRRSQGHAGLYDLVVEVALAGQLPVTLLTAGGIATPDDVAMMMQLGAEGVFVGSGTFKSGAPAVRAAAIGTATTFFDDPDVLARVSRELGEPMVGINVEEIAEPHGLAQRGW